MTNRLKNKKALITAAGQGIGFATALAFANEGAKVIATDINPDTLNSLSNENSQIGTRVLDVTKTDEIQQVAEEMGSIDVNKKADMILLDKNPLIDISNTRTITHVISQGRAFNQETLLAMTSN